jgi:drug/metabolite transporter (DMT)-like permease
MRRPNWKVALGLVVGFIGVWLLVSGQGSGVSPDNGQWMGVVAVIFGTLSWAAGSIYGLRGERPRSSLLAAGMQMVAGSVPLLLVGLVRGEFAAFDPSAVSRNSLLGLGYLIIFGSLLAFTAYSWLLQNARPSMVATYAYVNPVIAVLLGWLIAGESMTTQMLVGAAVVVGAVIVITTQTKAMGEVEDADEDSCVAEPRYST